MNLRGAILMGFLVAASSLPAQVVAVLPPAWLGVVDDSGHAAKVGERLTNFLGACPQIRVVERIQLRKLLQERSLATSGLVETTDLGWMGSELGADHLVVGSVGSSGRGLVGDFRLVHLATGQVLATTSLTANGEARLAESVGQEILAAAGIRARPDLRARFQTWVGVGFGVAALGLGAGGILEQVRIGEAEDDYRSAIDPGPGGFDRLANRVGNHTDARNAFLVGGLATGAIAATAFLVPARGWSFETVGPWPVAAPSTEVVP
jgi:Curli production assembly/transport component CsgG